MIRGDRRAAGGEPRLDQANMKKPVVGYVPAHGPQGAADDHAGAIISAEGDTRAEKADIDAF